MTIKQTLRAGILGCGEAPLVVKPEEALQARRILALIQQSAVQGHEMAAQSRVA